MNSIQMVSAVYVYYIHYDIIYIYMYVHQMSLQKSNKMDDWAWMGMVGPHVPQTHKSSSNHGFRQARYCDVHVDVHGTKHWPCHEVAITHNRLGGPVLTDRLKCCVSNSETACHLDDIKIFQRSYMSNLLQTSKIL